MKKILCLFLVLILSLSVITACGNNGTKNQKTPNDIVSSSDEKNEEEKKEDTVLPDTTPAKEDENKDAASKKNNSKTKADKNKSNRSPSDFYLVLNGTDEESILYHIGSCPLLVDKDAQKTSWEMIKMLEFRHCTKCNPPKYEGYVE